MKTYHVVDPSISDRERVLRRSRENPSFVVDRWERTTRKRVLVLDRNRSDGGEERRVSDECPAVDGDGFRGGGAAVDEVVIGGRESRERRNEGEVKDGERRYKEEEEEREGRF